MFALEERVKVLTDDLVRIVDQKKVFPPPKSVRDLLPNKKAFVRVNGNADYGKEKRRLCDTSSPERSVRPAAGDREGRSAGEIRGRSQLRLPPLALGGAASAPALRLSAPKGSETSAQGL